MDELKEMNPVVYRRKCFLINMAYFVAIGAIVLLIIRYALSALTPFVIALITASALRPILRFLHTRLKLPRRLTGIVLTVSVYLLLALLGVVLVDRILDAIISFLSSLPVLWNDMLMPALSRLGGNLMDSLAQLDVQLDLSFDEVLRNLGSEITSLSRRALGMIGNVAFSLPSMLISVIICIVSTLFMLFDWDTIVAFIHLQLSGRNSELAQKAMNQSGSTIKQYVVSYGLILLITFTELSIGFVIIGFKNPLLLAALISVFDILPVVGCGGIVLPWAVISFIIGNTRIGFGLIILYLVITTVRNVVEPKIVGKQVGLHPLVTIMSMVIGSSLMGGIGLFGLPITLAVINKMNKDGIIKFYKTSSMTEKK